MRTPAALVIAALLAGCGAASAPPAAPQEDDGLPLVSPAPPPAPPAEPPRVLTPLAAAACAGLRLELGATRSVIAREAYERTLAGAEPLLHDAVCACPPREAAGWLVVTATPDRGEVTARLYDLDHPEPALDACLAARLQDARTARFHLGTDCIGCGPRSYGVFRGSAPAAAHPVDGVATLNFLVRASR